MAYRPGAARRLAAGPLGPSSARGPRAEAAAAPEGRLQGLGGDPQRQAPQPAGPIHPPRIRPQPQRRARLTSALCIAQRLPPCSARARRPPHQRSGPPGAGMKQNPASDAKGCEAALGLPGPGPLPLSASAGCVWGRQRRGLVAHNDSQVWGEEKWLPSCLHTHPWAPSAGLGFPWLGNSAQWLRTKKP